MYVKIGPWFAATIYRSQRAIKRRWNMVLFVVFCGASWEIPPERSHPMPRLEDIGSGTDVFVHIKDCYLILATQGLMIYYI